MRMVPPVLALAVLALLVLSWGLWQRSGRIAAEIERDHAAEMLAEAELALEHQRERAEVHRAAVDRLEREAAKWRALEDEAVIEGGADAPASDYLRRTLDRVR